MPVKAKQMTDRLIQVSQEAVFKLEQEPSTTVDFVTLLTFLEEIQEQMEQIEDDSGIVRDLYELIEKHQVPVNPEDLAMYQVLFNCFVDAIKQCTHTHTHTHRHRHAHTTPHTHRHVRTYTHTHTHTHTHAHTCARTRTQNTTPHTMHTHNCSTSPQCNHTNLTSFACVLLQ